MFITRQTYVIQNINGVIYRLCEFECDSVADLPAQAQTGWNVMTGSKAHVIDANSLYAIKSTGAWVLQNADGTAGYTKEEIDALLDDKANTTDVYTKTETDGEILGAINDLDVSSVGGTTKYIYQIKQTNGKISANSYPSDATPTNGSTKLVQSGGVKTYVDNAKTAANNYTDTQVATKASINDVFGTGGNTYIPDSSDLNTYTQAGVYVRQFSTGLADFSNIPMDGTTYAYQPFRLVVEYLNSPNNIIQTLIPTYSNCGYFKRVRIFGASGTWQPWVYFSGTAVTQSVQSINPQIMSVNPVNRINSVNDEELL